MEKKESDRIDQLIGKEERISQYGITKEELRERPVALEFDANGFSPSIFVWNIIAEADYSKLERMSCKEAVEYMLEFAPLRAKRDGELFCLNADDTKARKDNLDFAKRHGPYVIVTEEDMVIHPEGQYTIGGKPNEDERARPILDYLRSDENSEGKQIWRQQLDIRLPYSIDDCLKRQEGK
jgi:hypothetical protein